MSMHSGANHKSITNPSPRPGRRLCWMALTPARRGYLTICGFPGTTDPQSLLMNVASATVSIVLLPLTECMEYVPCSGVSKVIAN